MGCDIILLIVGSFIKAPLLLIGFCKILHFIECLNVSFINDSFKSSFNELSSRISLIIDLSNIFLTNNF